MTILQLKYVVAISTSASMREASSKLYVSQPALSATIRDLEEEVGVRIFERTNKGIHLTEKGNEFLGFAKQAVCQYELLENKYLGYKDGKERNTPASPSIRRMKQSSICQKKLCQVILLIK